MDFFNPFLQKHFCEFLANAKPFYVDLMLMYFNKEVSVFILYTSFFFSKGLLVTYESRSSVIFAVKIAYWYLNLVVLESLQFFFYNVGTKIIFMQFFFFFIQDGSLCCTWIIPFCVIFRSEHQLSLSTDTCMSYSIYLSCFSGNISCLRQTKKASS